MVRMVNLVRIKTKVSIINFLQKSLVLSSPKGRILTIRLKIDEKLKCGGGLPSKTE